MKVDVPLYGHLHGHLTWTRRQWQRVGSEYISMLRHYVCQENTDFNGCSLTSLL